MTSPLSTAIRRRQNAARFRRTSAAGALNDPVVVLSEFADGRGLDLAAYHDACRQLETLLGRQFAEHTFAESVLARLKLEDADVHRAVSDTFAETLEA